ncbi:hypothetical protein BJ912DRAFT_922074 [Pholiota molesta]|nr:hypothetical protein BJ912DRAFT_922074 [Pholiota molesta]
MNDLTPLNRPVQSQVKIDPAAKECPSEGFNSFDIYNLFDVANSKGWFVAVKHSTSGSDLLFSTLEDLRSSFSSAKDSPDANEVHPLTSAHVQTTSVRQIVPNPGAEPGLSDLIAVVSNGKVQLLDTQLEPQGGWTATDLMTQPIAASWSPKGKHIAIGDSSPKQHIIVLDTKTSTATYFAPDHPFAISDRNFQNAYVLSFPKWDADSASIDENKSLTIVGDASSVDLEFHGGHYPLALESDLTDSTAAAPIMYAYLNDGSLQGWHLEHSKPYLGIITPTHLVSTQVQEAGKDTDMSAEETAAPNALPNEARQRQVLLDSPAFPAIYISLWKPGQRFWADRIWTKITPSHVGVWANTFGQPSAFGAASGFGSSAFSQSNQNEASTSAFGSVKPAAGFGAFGGTNNAFGSSGSSPFGSTTSGAFGNLSSSPSNAFGQASFGSNVQPANEPPSSPTMTREASMSDSTPSLGGFGLGSATPSDPNARNSMFGSFSTTTSTPTTNDQSSGFGSGPLVKPATGFGAFGSFKPNSTFEAPKPATSTTSAFGFANPAFGKPAFGSQLRAASIGKPSLGAPSTTSTTSGGFSAFANTPTAFGSATSTTTPGSGGFSAFASAAPSTFGTALGSTAASESKPTTEGGFGAFASNATSSGGAFSAFASNTPSAFESSEPTKESTKTTSAFGGSTTTTTTSSPFAAPSTPAADATSRTSVFGTTKNAFAGTSSSAASPSAFATPSRPSPFANIDEGSPGSPEHASPPSSPEPHKSPAAQPTAVSFTPSSTPNAFSNLQTTPSAFKPASGFGAFGSFGGPNANSPFYKKPSPKTPTNAVAAPTFGSTSALGGVKSAFTPVTPPTTTPTKGPTVSAFSAFSGASSSFSAYVPNKTSFADLLKTGGEETTDPEKAPAPPLVSKSEEKDVSERISLFATPKTPLKKGPTAPLSAFAPISKEDGKVTEKKKPVSEEPSYGSISVSSTSSSFVEVTEEESKEEGEYEEGEVEEPQSDEDAEHSGDEDDTNSFLSETFSDSYQEEESGEEGSSDKEENELPEEEEEGEESAETPVTSKDLSRSPSATPQPETPSIKITLSPDEEEEQPAEPQPQERERSATPPGTPVKEPISPITQPPTTPVSNATPPSFGIGLGRPSTRPARSSPLANAISRSDDEDEEKKIVAPIPVSPKAPPVEVLPVKLEEDEKEETPSLAPVSSPSSTKPDVPALGGLGALAAAAASSPSIFGKVPEKTLAPSQPLFGRPATVPPSLPATAPSLATGPPSPSLFGGSPFSLKNAIATPSGPSGIKSPTLPPMPAQATNSLFGTPKQAPKTPAPSMFGGAIPGISPPKPSPLTEAPLTPQTLSPPRPEAALEEGMQKECMRLVISMQSDFLQTQHLLQAAYKTKDEIKSQLGGSRLKADLGDRTKWTLNDLEQFKRVLTQYEADLDIFESNKEKDQQTLREIQSNMLKAGTRREEIARFNKAKDDKEFAKMLRSRTLGPEYSETQAQLRKSIRTIRDRIQKLETHLEEDKKKLARSTSYKPSFRAPSLDTINRTYRNIEIAIDQQSDEVARLAARVSKLNMKEATVATLTRDARLPDVGNRQPSDITQNVAAITAAALNAERAASRLKKALLSVRSEPLLNTKVSTAPSAPVDFATPKKTPSSGPSLFGETSTAGEAFADWDIPPDNFDPNGSHLLQGIAEQRKRKSTNHSNGIQYRHLSIVQIFRQNDDSNEGSTFNNNASALPDLRIRDTLASAFNLPRTFWPSKRTASNDFSSSGINFNPNGSAFLWLLQDTYAGKTFFDRWSFFDLPDYTHGTVTYVNQTTAFQNKYAYVQDDGIVIMKADDTTVLPPNVNRSSVRISSNSTYNGGLFILDLNKAPWGCAIWPAFWTTGLTWPANGEIDILEGVHDNEHNQVTWHTNPGCQLDPNAAYTGQVVQSGGTNNTNCDANANDNSGCAVIEWSQASYGPFFEAQGGGILAMKWDENDISVWSFFRAAIPTDVTQGNPNPSLWGPPSAMLKNDTCNIENYFVNHTIVFDITFCGDWAGNSYATSGCPGTCADRLMDPTNFVVSRTLSAFGPLDA